MNSNDGLESSASGVGVQNGKPVNKPCKRHLSPRECEVLLGSLKELIANGWKSDNGFRGGYLNKLEELMRKEFPGTDLKGMPHLNSKIQTWKRNYNSLTTMLSKSGIGFKNNMIDCSDQVWDEIIKCDANAKAMRRKTWDMFEDWKLVFGKDRANGDQAEDFLDAVNGLFDQETKDRDEAAREYRVKLDDLHDSSAWEQTTCGSDSGNGAAKHSPGDVESRQVRPKHDKKRKTREETESIVEVLREMSHNSNTRLETIASRIGHAKDMDHEKAEAFVMLDAMPDLSLNEKLDVCEILVFKTERLLIFKSLPESARLHYVHRLLKEKYEK